MKEFIEKLIERLEEEKAKGLYAYDSVANVKDAWGKAIEIVNQLAEEYNNGWILCSKELPPQPEENPLFDNRTLELYLVSDSISDYMNKFKECNQCPHEFNDKNLEPCKDCVPKKKTNADRIRAMSDEELAKKRIDRIDIYTKSDSKEYIGDFDGVANSLEEAIEKELDWLRSEAE